jgi:hypothetical protein
MATVVRVVRMTIQPDAVTAWVDAMRGIAESNAGTMPGLVLLASGTRTAGAEIQGTLVTVWASLEDLQQAIGDSWEQAVVPPAVAALSTTVDVEHYEGIGWWSGLLEARELRES